MSRKLTVVKPGGPPAQPPQRSYVDFEKFVKLEHELCKYHDAIQEALNGLAVDPVKGEWRARVTFQEMTENNLRKKVEAYIKGASWYERDELYDEDEDGDLHVKRHVIAEHVAAMLGSFPVAPHSPEVFVRRMIEEIIVLNPWASDIERGCRQLIRKSKFPDIAALIETISQSDGTKSFIDDLIERDEDTGEYWIVGMHRELVQELNQATLAIEEAKELKETIRLSDVSRFKPGDRVRHLRFGRGEVDRTLGKTVAVKFDDGRRTSVIDRFLSAESQGR
jgi:hypothetical protein